MRPSRRIRPAWLVSELARAENTDVLRRITPRRLRELRADVRLARARPSSMAAPRDQLLIVESSFPAPDKDSGSDRIVRLARLAALMGYETVMASLGHRDWARVEPTDVDDLVLTPEPDRWDDARFWQWVERSRAIWLCRPEVGGRILPALGGFDDRRVIYDTNDLYHVRIDREADVSGSRADRRLARCYFHLERELLRSADVTIAITPADATILGGIAPGARVDVVPNVHEERSSAVPPRAGRRGLLFVGNYKHGPNVDAVRHLIAEIMPAVWETLPDTELHLVGARLPEDVTAGADERIVVDGWVEDLQPVLDGAVALAAPLRFGSGMKGKIGLAMAHGLPVVTSPMGAEGMGLVDGEHALIGADDVAFVERCRRVLTDDDVWAHLSSAGQERIRSTWSASALESVVRRVIES